MALDEDDVETVHSRKYRLRIRTANAEYEGLFSSPYPDRRLSEVLARVEQFLNLKEARDVGSGEQYPFVIISKSSIETIKVMEEWK